MKRAWILALAMLLTAALSAIFAPRQQAQNQARATVPLEQLFPVAVGAWQPDPNVALLIRPAFEQARQFQMYDQVLERVYVNNEGYRIMLSVAYGRQQSVGLQMHRPEVCYKAGGFKVEAVQSGLLPLQARQMPVTRLFASMEGRPEPVTYWRMLGDEVVTDEVQFKLRQLSLGARGSLADGMLVRVSSVDDDMPRAYAMHARFAQDLALALNPAQRLRVMGW